MFSKHKEGIPSKMIDLDIRECKSLDLETDCNTTKAKAYYAFSVLIVMALAIFWCYQKKGMFLDEIYSYGLSNGFFTPFLKTIKQDDMDADIATHISLSDRILFKRLRIMSILIFFGHTLAIFIVSNMSEVLKRIGLSTPSSLIQFIIIVVVCIVAAYTIERLSHNEKLKVLRYLYS